MTAINVAERKHWIGLQKSRPYLASTNSKTGEYLVKLKAGLIQPDDLSAKPAVVWAIASKIPSWRTLEPTSRPTQQGRNAKNTGLTARFRVLERLPDSIGTWTGSDTRV